MEQELDRRFSLRSIGRGHATVDFHCQVTGECAIIDLDALQAMELSQFFYQLAEAMNEDNA
jgi:hypothetical protein